MVLVFRRFDLQPNIQGRIRVFELYSFLHSQAHMCVCVCVCARARLYKICNSCCVFQSGLGAENNWLLNGYQNISHISVIWKEEWGNNRGIKKTEREKEKENESKKRRQKTR